MPGIRLCGHGHSSRKCDGLSLEHTAADVKVKEQRVFVVSATPAGKGSWYRLRLITEVRGIDYATAQTSWYRLRFRWKTELLDRFADLDGRAQAVGRCCLTGGNARSVVLSGFRSLHRCRHCRHLLYNNDVVENLGAFRRSVCRLNGKLKAWNCAVCRLNDVRLEEPR